MKKILNIKIIVLLIILISLCAVYLYLYLAKVGSTINLDDSNIPEIMPKADNCNSPYVENEIISLFKKNDKYYKFISYKSIDSIDIVEKNTIIKDIETEKYICYGIIELLSDFNGFKPITYDINNLYYQKINIKNDDKKIEKYTSYRTPVFYSSQMKNGKNYYNIVKIENGEFNCKGVCSPVFKAEKKIENNILVETNNVKTGKENKKIKPADTIIQKDTDKNKKSINKEKLKILKKEDIEENINENLKPAKEEKKKNKKTKRKNKIIKFLKFRDRNKIKDSDGKINI